MPHEPKRRHSTERKGVRRASIRLFVQKGINCSNCQAPVMPHTICGKCGFYKGKKVLTMKKPKEEKQPTQ